MEGMVRFQYASGMRDAVRQTDVTSVSCASPQKPPTRLESPGRHPPKTNQPAGGRVVGWRARSFFAKMKFELRDGKERQLRLSFTGCKLWGLSWNYALAAYDSWKNRGQKKIESSPAR